MGYEDVDRFIWLRIGYDEGRRRGWVLRSPSRTVRFHKKTVNFWPAERLVATQYPQKFKHEQTHKLHTQNIFIFYFYFFRFIVHSVECLLHTPIHAHTYLLTPWCRVLLEKLTGLQLVKKFPAFHGTRRFISALTSVRHLSLSWASPIQSIYPYPTSWRSILILSTHLRLGLPSGLLPSGSPSKTLYTPLSSPPAPYYTYKWVSLPRGKAASAWCWMSTSMCCQRYV